MLSVTDKDEYQRLMINKMYVAFRRLRVVAVTDIAEYSSGTSVTLVEGSAQKMRTIYCTADIAGQGILKMVAYGDLVAKLSDLIIGSCYHVTGVQIVARQSTKVIAATTFTIVTQAPAIDAYMGVVA